MSCISQSGTSKLSHTHMYVGKMEAERRCFGKSVKSELRITLIKIKKAIIGTLSIPNSMNCGLNDGIIHPDRYRLSFRLVWTKFQIAYSPRRTCSAYRVMTVSFVCILIYPLHEPAALTEAIVGSHSQLPNYSS